MERERIQYLDIIKVIAIFLVVFCHFVLLAETVPANLFMVSCWAGVPLFFMVNGALLFTRPLNLKKHIRKTNCSFIFLHLGTWMESERGICGLLKHCWRYILFFLC